MRIEIMVTHNKRVLISYGNNMQSFQRIERQK